MPKYVSEIAPGQTVSRSSDGGALVTQATRVFRVLLASPGEVIDVQSTCKVKIGDQHPINPDIFCKSFDAQFEGDSRVVILCTFNYATWLGTNEAPDTQVPGTRPANWTMSTSLAEVPVTSWKKRFGENAWADDFTPAVNAAGDHYDGLTKLVPLVTIQITQEDIVSVPPLVFSKYIGYVNDDEINLASLVIKPHTLMFRGMNSQPYVEEWQGRQYRGWKTTYEFVYKSNVVDVFAGVQQTLDIGWDIAVPQSGYNTIAFKPDNPQDIEDIFGQPLMHGKEGTKYEFRILPPEDGGYKLPDGVKEGERVPAMIKVFSYKDGGTSQTRCASPIALNQDGRPRNVEYCLKQNKKNLPPVLVQPYQVQPSIGLVNILRLRLR